MFSRVQVFFVLTALLMFGSAAVQPSTAQATVPPIMIDDQVILPGESFLPIDLASAVQDDTYPADQLAWTVTGNSALTVEFTDGMVSVTLADATWTGQETLHFEACDPSGVCSAADAIFWVMADTNDEVTVTFVGNAGYLFTIGDKKILIDGLFQGFEGVYMLPAEEQALLANAQPPFDNIDLILATHEHADHFDAAMVCQHLQNDPQAVFVSTPVAVNDVIAAGCAAQEFDLQSGESAERVINGIGVEAIYLSHGEGALPNLGYLITVGGRRIFQTGDIDTTIVTVDYLQSFGLPDKQIDLAMVQHFYMRAAHSPILEDGIHADYYIPIHLYFTNPPANLELVNLLYPDAIILDTELESWKLGDPPPQVGPSAPPPIVGPVLALNDQVILPDESFQPVVLADVVLDEQYPDDQITWTVTGNTALTAQIVDDVVTITPPDTAWLGQETLHFEACDPSGVCAEDEVVFWAMEDANVPVTVTFVGNSGFLVTAGDKKILFDGLFAGFEGDYTLPPEELDLLLNAQPPFDNIDLILASHDHGDHFSAEMVALYMENVPGAVFVSVESAANQISSLGYPAIPINIQRGGYAQVVVNGIGVEAIYLSHGDNTFPNLGLIVTVGGRRFFHSGDTDPASVTLRYVERYNLAAKHIDVAFITHFALNSRGYQPVVTEAIQPAYIFPIHYAYTTPPMNLEAIQVLYPDAVIFQSEMETWTLP